MKKEKQVYIPICLTILIFAVLIISRVTQNDLFFDIKTGESILKYGIDFKDHFSFIPNLRYIYHHYLYDLIIYFIYKLGSFQGVFIFLIVICSLFSLTLFYVNNKYTHNKIGALTATLVTMFLCSGYIVDRVQTITYLLFFLEIYFIEQLYTKGKVKYTIYLIILSILIANLHMPMWLLTVIFFLPALLEMIVKIIEDKIKIKKRIFKEKIIINKPQNIKLFTITFGLVLGTGILTPLKLYPYTFFLKVLGNDSFQFIQEMRPTVLMENMMLVVLIIIMIVITFLLNTKVKFRDVIFLLGLSFLAMIADRNIAYIYLFFPTMITKILLEANKLYLLNVNKIKQFFKKVNWKMINIFLSSSLVIIYIGVFKTLDFNNFDYGIIDLYPDKCVDYIKKNTDYKKIRLYNDFNNGSYLEFNDIPVFIDSRAEVYIPIFNGGYDIISDYLKTDNYLTYKEVFDKYKFNYALVDQEEDLFKYLKQDKDFEMVFQEVEKGGKAKEYALFKYQTRS